MNQMISNDSFTTAFKSSHIFLFVLIPLSVSLLKLVARGTLESIFRKCFFVTAARHKKHKKAFISEASINIFTFRDFKLHLSFLPGARAHSSVIYL
jgi:hypothetical protein